MTIPSVSEFAPPVGAVSSSKGAGKSGEIPIPDVGAVRHGLTDEDRERAICRCIELAAYFEAEYRLFWALWTRDGLFDQKAAYDIAMGNYLRAQQIRDSLMRGAKQ